MISNKKEPINATSLFFSVAMLVIGIILLVNGSTKIFDIIGYIVSGLLILSGIIKLILAYRSGKKYNDQDVGAIIGSIGMISFGAIIACFPKSIMYTFSICMGALITFVGIQKLILGIAVRKIDANGAKVFIIESTLIILLGLIVLSCQLLNLIGLFLIIYAISELVGYIYYKSQDKDYSEVLNKKITKEMIESEAKDAIVEEDGE